MTMMIKIENNEKISELIVILNYSAKCTQTYVISHNSTSNLLD